jgi:Holliday junction resolvase RusA-like endonuclease
MTGAIHIPRQWRFTLVGAPRTKKTSNIMVTKGKPRILPSKAFSAWNRIAQVELARVRSAQVGFPIEGHVNVRAWFYQDVDRADPVGLYQALADALQEGRIVINDRQIRSWDGSRLLADKENPRIEVWITEIL